VISDNNERRDVTNERQDDDGACLGVDSDVPGSDFSSSHPLSVPTFTFLHHMLIFPTFFDSKPITLSDDIVFGVF
jgi:hypothetical protein